MQTDYYGQVSKLYDEAILNLKNTLEEGQKIQLFDFSKDDWYEDEAYYELPTQFLYGKYNYADMYYLYLVYKEKGNVFIKGRENEDSNEYDFRPEDINAADLTFLVDMINENLNSK